jgi:hypothetical protein
MGRLRAAITTVAIIACVTAACAARPAEAQALTAPPNGAGTPTPRTQWIGMPRRELFKKLGQPSQIFEYPDTGGQRLIYSHPGQPHYVFETGPDNKVISATETKTGK